MSKKKNKKRIREEIVGCGSVCEIFDDKESLSADRD